MTAPHVRRLWMVSELYHPEETSTGYFATGLAEGLAEAFEGSFEVHVLCSQPTYSARGTLAPRREVRRGVTIERCAGTRFDKDRIALRLLNLVSISLSIGWAAWRRLRPGDLALVVTNPPTLPFVVLAAARLRGARVVLRLEDVYPDVLVATGALASDSPAVRAIRSMAAAMCAGMERVVVLGRDQAELAASSLGVPPERTVVIPHWGGAEATWDGGSAINPVLASRGLGGRFIVQYMGNMGRTHGVDTVALAASALRGRDDIHFLLIGWGARKAALERSVAQGGMHNVTLLPPVPRAEVPVHMAAADVTVIAFQPGMAGISVPSRMYDVMAAGKPILAVADETSELALVVREERIGWVVPPGDADALAAAIERAAALPRESLQEMGRRAREAVLAHYTRERAVVRYRALIDRLAMGTGGGRTRGAA